MSMKILIVDDDDVLRSELSEWLTREGYEVESVDSGKAALEMVKKRDFELILTDLKMPGMDGIDVLEAVKKLKPQGHVVMITAFGTIDTAVKAMKIGADDYICKPFEMEQLQYAIENVAKIIDYEKRIKKVDITEKPSLKDPFEFFKFLLKDGKGLCITKHNPDEISAKYGLQDVSMMWLTPEESSELCVHPRNVSDLKSKMEHFFQNNPEGVVLLDGVELLIEQHSWEVIEKIITDISTTLLNKSSRFIVAIDPEQIEENILVALRYLIGRPSIQLISGSLSNPIRRQIVNFLSQHEPSRFTEILNYLKTNDAPKVSFHLKKLICNGIMQKDEEKTYTLTDRGKSAIDHLVMLEQEIVGDIPNNVILILSSKTQ